MENVIFSAPVSLCFVEFFWQKHRTSANNCIKHKAMVVGQKSSKSLGVILYVLHSDIAKCFLLSQKFRDLYDFKFKIDDSR